MSIVPIASPVDPAALERELVEERLITEMPGIGIYLVDGRETPDLMDEIGRIREVEFRAEGGGTGKPRDIDRFDLEAPSYRQLVAWDWENREIVAMYRFLPGWVADPSRYDTELATGRLFSFSSRFLDEYLPLTIELGRSVVNRAAKRRLKGLFAVWTGLGALVSEYPQARYFFGKVTTYDRYDRRALALLHRFLRTWFEDADELVRPRTEYAVDRGTAASDDLDFGLGMFDDDSKRLSEALSDFGETIPPLIHAYMRLTPAMRVFGTAKNDKFGDVEETAILVPIDEINSKMKRTYIDRYESLRPEVFVRAAERDSG